MKHLPHRFAGFLVLAFAFFSLSHTAEAGGRGGARRPPPKIPYTAIVSVDTAAKTITVEPRNSTATGSKTYKFTDKTAITVNGKYGTVADLTPGQQIHVGAGMDPLVAEELKVSAPPADPIVPGRTNPSGTSSGSSYSGRTH